MKYKALMHHDLLRISTQGMTGGILCGAIIGTDHVITVIFQALVTFFAVLTTIDHTTYADQIAHHMTGNFSTNRCYATNDLMTRHTGKYRTLPLCSYLVNIRVTKTTVSNGNLHIM